VVLQLRRLQTMGGNLDREELDHRIPAEFMTTVHEALA
jgi:hypothetical protein